jgi:hypothetical protein
MVARKQFVDSCSFCHVGQLMGQAYMICAALGNAVNAVAKW